MRTIVARNVNEALPQGLRLLQESGILEGSREGEVLAAPYPVVTHYLRPWERVLFDPVRDANPFFHLFEALWMLAGRNDLVFVEQFAGRIRQYSDDGKTLTGSAYGYAWRRAEGFDQLEEVVQLLKRSPGTRRAVLQMWQAADIEKQNSASLPCNTAVYFRIQGGYLQMTVTCRSNDMIWGAYGSNVVHFSMLQEYVAGRVGCGVGSYFQLSNNFHAYTDNPYMKKLAAGAPGPDDSSGYTEWGWFPMFDPVRDPALWDRDLKLFFADPSAVGFEHRWWAVVAKPLWFAHKAYKKRDWEAAFDCVARCEAADWRVAALRWLERRQKGAKE